MTEAEWLISTNLEALVEFLDQAVSTTRRKCRLLSCAACYRLGPLLIHPASHLAVRAAEQWADCESTDEALKRAWLEAGPSTLFEHPFRTDSPEYSAAMAASKTAYPKPDGRLEMGAIWSALSVADDVIEAVGQAAAMGAINWSQHPTAISEEAGIANLIRDIFGNPFRPVTLSSDWRTSTVTTLAAQMYESRDFSAMLILADALQDAGCDSDDVLNHCRGSGPHVRGCWIVDLVLGKE